MTQEYQVIFQGDITPGVDLKDVKQQLQSFFKLDDARLNQLFCGRPLSIKKHLTAEKAQQLCDSLAQMGAVARIKIMASGQPGRGDTDKPGNNFKDEKPLESAGITLATVGADVLNEGERAVQVAIDVPTDHLSLDNPGADVLRPSERKKVETLALDLSRFEVEIPEED